MNVADDVGLREVEEIRIAGDVARVIGEPGAAVRLLPLDGLLDQDAVRAVEYDDSLVEKFPELFDRRLHNAPVLKTCGSGGSAGSLGVW